MRGEPSSTASALDRADAVDAPIVDVGEIVDGRYRVDEIIGAGAMGVVVRATHLDLGEVRAIKFMRWTRGGTDRKPSLDKRAAERFVREARAASRLTSPHVAHVFDLGRMADGAPFIVMEHLEGYDLRARIDDGGTLGPIEATATAIQALHALAEAHACGIVHRDLKPSNLFVSSGSRPMVKILDFGIAKVRPDPERDAAAGGEVTRDSDILGSPLYMAPEQVRATRDVDARADLWSLGVILFVALTGTHPFEGATVADILVEVLTKPAPDLRSLRADVPAPLARVVARCLEKDRAARPRSAEVLARLLLDATDDRAALRAVLLPDVDAWLEGLPPDAPKSPSGDGPTSGDGRPTPVFAAPVAADDVSRIRAPASGAVVRIPARADETPAARTSELAPTSIAAAEAAQTVVADATPTTPARRRRIAAVGGLVAAVIVAAAVVVTTSSGARTTTTPSAMAAAPSASSAVPIASSARGASVVTAASAPNATASEAPVAVPTSSPETSAAPIARPTKASTSVAVASPTAPIVAPPTTETTAPPAPSAPPIDPTRIRR